MPRVRTLLRYGAYQVGFSLVGLAVFLRATFGELTVDQVLWHVRYADKAAQLSEVFLVEAAVHALLVPLVLAVLATVVHGMAAPRLAPWQRRGARALPALLAGWGLGAFALQVSAFSHAAAYFEPDLFARHYVAPAQVALEQPRQRRNLVVIYAESLEKGYGDAAVFGKDLLAPLHAAGGHSYASYRPVAGATWTIAGMVATQCGVPLKVYAESDVQARETGKTFLRNATCLGDVLRARGYRNVFLGGAPLSFAGKGRFLRDHGYDELWGREEWERAGVPRRDFNAWGLYDGPLFDRARAQLERLHAAGQPFNLTLLTLDTHNPNGFLSPDCRRRGHGDFEGIVSCGAAQIAEFIAFARDRGYLRDTAIVVLGDHLAVPNPLYEQLERTGDARGMYNLFVGDGLPAPATTRLLPFDLFPTLVEIAGVDVPGDRLALGRSAVGPRGEERPAQVEKELASLGNRASAAYDRLWSGAPD